MVKDLPIHADFLRLSQRSRINLFIPVEFINEDDSPGLKKGGVLTVVRPEVELKVTAGDIPEKIVVDLTGLEINDVVTISAVDLPAGTRPMITDRDFVIANVSAPSSLTAEEEEGVEEGDEEGVQSARRPHAGVEELSTRPHPDRHHALRPGGQSPDFLVSGRAEGASSAVTSRAVPSLHPCVPVSFAGHPTRTQIDLTGEVAAHMHRIGRHRDEPRRPGARPV